MIRWLAARLRLLHGDRGVLDYAITFPAVILLLTIVAQASVYFVARNTAIAAAQQGADSARAQGASIAEGDAAACRYAVTVGRGFLRGPACTGTGGVTVTVQVCGNAPSLLPGFPVRVCEAVQGARERFTAP